MTQTQFLRACRSRLIQCLALLSLVVGLPACAAPREPTDPVVRFLRERGLVESGSQAAESGNRLFDSVRDKASDLVLTAMNFLGVPYRYGGVSEDSGFDCSGFTRYVFERSMGLLLPRRAEDQASTGSLLNIAVDDLKPGDLVFFNTMRRTFSHVGIYVGEGKFIHAPRTGTSVRVEDMRQAYWTNRFNGARRAPELSASVSSTTLPTTAINPTSSVSP